ncbi:MAG: hypothetical protein Q4D76_03635 [Oscillospiraceae bacterium]|nr:hypothetical protein [Oscillospiraceae bacterium]
MKLNKNKIIIISASFVYCLSLCSFGSKKVELLDNGKLIDFERAITLTHPGAETNETVNTGEPLPYLPEVTGTGAVTSVTEFNESKNEIIYIRVNNEQIFYQDKVVSAESLKNKIIDNNREKVEFSVSDDYAEYHVLMNVIDLTEKLRKDYNVVVHYDFELG